MTMPSVVDVLGIGIAALIGAYLYAELQEARKLALDALAKTVQSKHELDTAFLKLRDMDRRLKAHLRHHSTQDDEAEEGARSGFGKEGVNVHGQG